MNANNFKDGDILCASDGSIFLCAGIEENAAKYYFALSCMGDLKISNGMHYWEVASECEYATNTQVAQLLNAVSSAGYYWDNEKNILKKIR